MDERFKISIMNLNKNLLKKFRGNLSEEIFLSKYSWFNLGGPAEFFFKPANVNQLLEFLRENKKNKLKITILGAGSNTLIRDKGIKGVVIKLGSKFSKIKLIDKDILEVGAGALDRKVADYAKIHGIGNLEFLSCIPGSIGGAIIMNSGCYENDISQILLSLKVIDIIECKEKEIEAENINFFYRGTNLSKNFIITSAKLKGEVSSRGLIEKKQEEMIKKKKLTQPSQVKTCGSTFKNISREKKAWMLIKEAGCDEFREGDASISQKHCNFFINNGKAKSSDVEKLINRVRQTINEKIGINLDLEIKIIGE